MSMMPMGDGIGNEVARNQREIQMADHSNLLSYWCVLSP